MGLIILGVILFAVGWLTGFSILFWIGLALIIFGLILLFVPVGGVRRGEGRRGYWY